MANSIYKTRTNYFRVTDEEQYDELVSKLHGCEDEIEFYTKETESGRQHMFVCNSDICWQEDPDAEDADNEIETFYKELQKIIPEGEGFILMEIGYEKLRWLDGFATIVTSNRIKYLTLSDIVLDTVQEVLGNDEFVTQLGY